MASYPGAKVHRMNRRKLGRGQVTPKPSANLVVTSATDTATLTFSVPVIVRGEIPMNVSGGLTFVEQVIVSPTVVTQKYSANVAAKTYSVAAGDPSVSTFQGGATLGASGTF